MLNMSNTMAAIFVERLRGLQCVTKIPLAYVLRKDEDVVPDGDDPQDSYPSPDEEMIQKAPHHEVVRCGTSLQGC